MSSRREQDVVIDMPLNEVDHQRQVRLLFQFLFDAGVSANLSSHIADVLQQTKWKDLYVFHVPIYKIIIFWMLYN